MMKTKRIILFILIYLGIVLVSTRVYANGIGKVINDNVRIREKASAEANILDLVSLNEKVEIISEEGDWYKVNYSNNKSGYIRKDMISLENADITSNTEKDNTNEQNNNSEEQTEQKVEEKLPIGFSGTLKNKIDIKIVPSINSTTILSIEENKSFKVLDKVNKWAYVEIEGNLGWVLTSKLNTENENSTTTEETNKSEESTSENEVEQQEEKEEEKQDNKQEENKKEVKQTKYVSTEVLNVRKSAEKTSEAIDQLSLNNQVTVVEIIDDSWAKVEYNGKSGYVSNKYLSDSKTKVTSRSETPSKTTETSSNQNTESEPEPEPAPKEEASSKSSGNASSVISYAKQYLGYRYVMGGTSPSTGFDCSGFTSYVYRHFGVSLSRTSSAQASNGTAVSRSNLQAGDILIFRDSSNSRVGHVGIYIGGNSFIHAANSRKGVIISSLSESYYSQRYVGARRVL